MLYSLLKTVHLLSVILWVGGMLFAHFFLRPSLTLLEPPMRLRLMHAVLGRFFAAVVVASLAVLVSGWWMWALHGAAPKPHAWTAMAAAGTLMVAIFGHIRFVLYARLTRAVSAADAPSGAAALAAVRRWVTVNLVLGIAIVAMLRLGGA